MGAPPEGSEQVRRATVADAPAAARLLHDFQTEFGEPVPELEVLSERVAGFIEESHAVFLLVGDGPDGIAELRVRPSLMLDGLEAYLEELYVAPARRGLGLGRALLEGAMDAARAEGAVYMYLGADEDDGPARFLYESKGFTNRSSQPDGPLLFFYERDL